MASVFKRGRDLVNRRVPWNFTYIDETGKRKQQKGFTDKASTEKLAMKLEEEARLVRDGLMQAEPQPEQRIPTFQLEQYIKHLSQRDVSKTQLANLELRVKKVLEGCKFELITEIKAQSVEDYLAKRREVGMSKQTSNHYRQSMHQFCKWLQKRSLLKANPISDIPKLNVETDRRHDRRALCDEEFQRLITAAEMGKSVQAIDGIDRAMMYILSAWTGYRRGEISSLTLASLELDTDPPRVSLEASHSKRRRKEMQVLHPQVAQRLQEWLKHRIPKHERYLFPLTTETCGYDRRTSIMMKHDLATAKAVWVSEAETDEKREERAKSDFLSYQRSRVPRRRRRSGCRS